MEAGEPPFFARTTFQVCKVDLLLLGRYDRFTIDYVFYGFRISDDFFDRDLVDDSDDFRITSGYIDIIYADDCSDFRMEDYDIKFDGYIRDLEDFTMVLDRSLDRDDIIELG